MTSAYDDLKTNVGEVTSRGEIDARTVSSVGFGKTEQARIVAERLKSRRRRASGPDSSG